MTVGQTSSGIAYERTGPQSQAPVVLIHAGVADRRMWDAIWPTLVTTWDSVRLDLRGFGDSSTPPVGQLSPMNDVIEVVAALGIERFQLVGSSFGAGVAVEVTVTRPDLVTSLLLCPPGGSLMPEMTLDLQAFFTAERTALAQDDLDAAVTANISSWVVGPRRDADAVDVAIREQIGDMQRRAFEITTAWPDVEEYELDPPVVERLTEIQIPVLALSGALDLAAIGKATELLRKSVANIEIVEWPDVAHLPTMERPADFLALLNDWLRKHG